MKKEISTKEDIRLLVDTFYDKVLRDEVLLPFFNGLDFDKHKPTMVAFWSFVLLDEAGYSTNVFDKHAHMHLETVHFEHWIKLFQETVNELFEGEKAEMAIVRAKTIAWTFNEKFKKLNAERASGDQH